jgi:hypothetical protein
MGSDWDDRAKWRREGRTGPNGPKYESRRNRRAVQTGKHVGRHENDEKGCLRDLIACVAIGGVTVYAIGDVIVRALS